MRPCVLSACLLVSWSRHSTAAHGSLLPAKCSASFLPAIWNSSTPTNLDPHITLDPQPSALDPHLPHSTKPVLGPVRTGGTFCKSQISCRMPSSDAAKTYPNISAVHASPTGLADVLVQSGSQLSRSFRISSVFSSHLTRAGEQATISVGSARNLTGNNLSRFESTCLSSYACAQDASWV